MICYILNEGLDQGNEASVQLLFSHRPNVITNRYSMAVTVTVSMSGGCICNRSCQPPQIRGASNTYHHACSCRSAEVQFAIDVTQVVSYGAHRAVERDHRVVLIQQLHKIFSGVSAKETWCQDGQPGELTTMSFCALRLGLQQYW